MEDYIDLYKKISNEILEILKCDKLDDDNLEICFEKRENIINNIEKKDKLDDFKKIYKESLYYIDKEIKILFEKKIIVAKKEIVEYKKSQNVNFTYATMNKNNFNIFSKKV